MKDAPDLCESLISITSELRTLEKQLKCEDSALDKAALQEFRQAIDEVRLTAWTVNELMNARESPESLLSFVASERMRRLSSMIRDLCADMDKQAYTWQSSGVQALSDAVLVLQARITKLVARHRSLKPSLNDRAESAKTSAD
jgi:hypothetical protein